MNMLTISPIRAFSDNYIWLIVRNNQAFVVDPGEPGPGLATLRAENVELSGILITHHHFDHFSHIKCIDYFTCTLSALFLEVQCHKNNLRQHHRYTSS